MSETPNAPAVYGAISSVMAAMAKEGIAKDRRNQQQGYNFRGIDDVYAALGKVLAENQLLILPRVVDQAREERKTAKGGMLLYTILTIEFDLVSAKDGSQHTIRMVGEAMDTVDKSSNKAQSAALKYAALQVFMIPTEGDNDADATNGQEAFQMPDDVLQELTGLVRDTKTDTAKMFAALAIKVDSLEQLSQVDAGRVKSALQRKLAQMPKEEGK
jgi:hypothetical protein